MCNLANMASHQSIESLSKRPIIPTASFGSTTHRLRGLSPKTIPIDWRANESNRLVLQSLHEWPNHPAEPIVDDEVEVSFYEWAKTKLTGN